LVFKVTQAKLVLKERLDHRVLLVSKVILARLDLKVYKVFRVM
jgi:hypothetical protein